MVVSPLQGSVVVLAAAVAVVAVLTTTAALCVCWRLRRRRRSGVVDACRPCRRVVNNIATERTRTDAKCQNNNVANCQTVAKFHNATDGPYA